MKITEYFIKHRVSAIILNCAILLIGVLCFKDLGLREYPDIKFPVIMVNTAYPNASAEIVESSVTNILEDRLAGVEGLDSIKSWSSANNSTITMKFLPDVSIDRALIEVKDAVGMAKHDLPEQILDTIVTRGGKEEGPPFMAACLESNSMNFSELTHYANITLKNTFRSLKGVASVDVWGKPYIYNITLDHKKMYNFGVNADEIYNAISKSDASLPAGKFQNKTPVTINSELLNQEDFENILVKNSPNPVFLKSVAKVELSEDNESLRLKINGKPALCIGINKTSDDNPLEISKLVHKQVAEIQATLPDNIKIAVLLDQANFIRASLNNIQSSIIEAIFFVLVIVFLFLRNLRATLIPIVTIPISLIGSLLFLKLFGFSINVMTLLAMVLAVGLVVDDAIIVLENITRHLEMGETPLQAALKGSKEIGFAIVAMTFTLTSVYAPIAFVTGITGQLFIEFAAALAGSVMISGIVAITLSPLMCAYILKNKEKHLFPQIDAFLDRLTDSYSRTLKFTMKHNKIIFSCFMLVFISMVVIFKILPHETVPSEDRSLIVVAVPAIPGETIDDNEKHLQLVEAQLQNIPEAQTIMTVAQEWGGYVILPLKNIEQRNRSADQLVNAMRPLLISFPSFDAWPWSFSSGLPGIDDPAENAELKMIISTTDSYDNLFQEVNKIRDIAEEQKLFQSISHNLKLENMGYRIDFDKDILAEFRVGKEQVAKTISIFFSGDKRLKFKKDGILYTINIKGDSNPWTLNELYITNFEGKRISIGSFASLKPKAEPKSLEHYNQMRSVILSTDLTSSKSLDASMQKLAKVVDDNLPQSYKRSWMGIAKTFNDNTTTMSLLFFLSLLFIYAILAVQFESFIDPLIILFTVPLACFGALLVLYLTNGTLNVYSQVGLITLIGLITKHGILIVEFANQLHSQGYSRLEAIEKSAALRLRPILMTTGAMICGSIPLILSHSSGFEARHAIGVVLCSGLGMGTFFTLFVLPSIYKAMKS